ncbi:MAG: DUF3006 domain-containing protein [Clostridia bacterium]
MKGVIDRFEEKYAVCELDNGVMINIGKDKLPINAKESDVVIMENNNILIDRIQATSMIS